MVTSIGFEFFRTVVGSSIKEGSEVALIDGESEELMGAMRIEEKYTSIKDMSVSKSSGRMTKTTPGWLR